MGNQRFYNDCGVLFMSNFIPVAESSHWYYPDGRPCYEMPMKTKPGQMRPTNVRDARELLLLPSVTTIERMVSNFVLQTWISNQYVLAAVTTPRLPLETNEDFAKRIVHGGQKISNTAKDFGTRLHDLAEGYLVGRAPEIIESQDLTFLEGFTKWCKEHKVEKIATEFGVANVPWGYAGRGDFLGLIDGVYCMADWKTQKTIPGKPISFYPDWNMQLSALIDALVSMLKSGAVVPDVLDMSEPMKVSVVISSTEPGRVQSFVWLDATPGSDEGWGLECFRAALRLFYSPLGPGSSLVKPVMLK